MRFVLATLLTLSGAASGVGTGAVVHPVRLHTVSRPRGQHDDRHPDRRVGWRSGTGSGSASLSSTARRRSGDVAVRAKGGAWKIAGIEHDARLPRRRRPAPRHRAAAPAAAWPEGRHHARRLSRSIKWDAFWDAPLNTDKLGEHARQRHPPPGGVAGQPGLARKPEEIARATATYQAQVVRGRHERRAPDRHVPGRHARAV